MLRENWGGGPLWTPDALCACIHVHVIHVINIGWLFFQLWAQIHKIMHSQKLLRKDYIKDINIMQSKVQYPVQLITSDESRQ